MVLRLSVLVLLTMCWGCSAQKKGDPLAGTYVGWMFIDGQAHAADGSQGMSQKLTLEPGGAYTLQTETSVMMVASIRAEGTYTHVRDAVSLNGHQTATVDDGYTKGTDSGPHQMTLKVKDSMLVMTDGKGDPFYFRKEGTGPPPLPSQLQLKQSDAAAIALIEKVEKAYASLKSFRATGSVKSNGGGFVAKDARFKVLYQSPSKFRFEASIFDGGTESDRAEITWDGGAKCWWYSKEFGETTDRTVGNALSIAAVTFGPEADILPSLLLPRELGQGGLSALYPEATLLPDEEIDGKVCAVLQLRTTGADATKLWIDESSGMILRLYEELRAVTVTFVPHPNVAIDSSEFFLGQRSNAGSD